MRACSPPERRETGVSSCSVRKRKRFAQEATWIERSPVDHRIPLRGQGAPQGHRAVERLAALLEEDGAQEGGALDFPVVRFEMPGEKRQQRRLAAAVRPQDAQPRAGRQRQADAVQDLLAFEGLAEFAGDEQLLGLAAGGGEVDAGGDRCRGAGLDLGQLVEEAVGLLDARLRLRGARLGAAAQPLQLAPRAVGERLLVLGLVAQHLVALLQEDAVGALDLEEAAGIGAGELHHPPGHVLQEIAVVADHHEGRGLADEQLLQPEDALEIEVVRGLVHQQDVRLLHQLAGDRQALAPAARQRAGGLGGIAEAGAAEDDRGAGGLLVVLQVLPGEGLDQHLFGRALGGNVGSCGT